MAEAKNPNLSAVAALVRRHDRDRYATALFAPADKRAHLFALYAFNYEVARIRETVREPIMGVIRLQWWRDAIGAAARGGPAPEHEVASPLSETIRAARLDPGEFERILRARELDLAPAPPETLAALEAYAADTAGALNVLALQALGFGRGRSARHRRRVRAGRIIVRARDPSGRAPRRRWRAPRPSSRRIRRGSSSCPRARGIPPRAAIRPARTLRRSRVPRPRPPHRAP